ncbi:endoplasmic reticulum metallopeptidase 1 [Caerostris extrusa]|uniref:Endoplasmic reticulum metallopeptidase 1 n=1 Tax=Caerostris extrusa TaxID=172846 RepID=A0AAV4X0K5_CAEEX|nr:endoplasmic reticulum metallopeptidase 1 [Caerostris extrusa]
MEALNQKTLDIGLCLFGLQWTILGTFIDQMKIPINSYTYRLSFVVTGPDHITALISPRKGVSLTKWSLTEEPLRSLDWVDRPSYFLYYSYAEYSEPWTFSIDLSVTKEYIKDSPLVDMSFITHYLHGHDLITGDFPLC